MDCPMESSTFSHSTVIRSFSSYCGLKRPSASLTERHFLKTIAFTLPFSVRISFGPQELFTEMPSSSASATSSFAAGMISRDSRQNMETSPEPARSAALATSTATLPPPTTTVRPESFVLSSRFTLLKNSTPVFTPSASSPGTPALRPPCAPIAT